jgi:hypothetical protein
MRFNPVNHPALLMQPRFLHHPFGWIGHIPFAFLAADLARPRTIVELGTHWGNSYCAFCQAVDALKLPTQCSAIDTWEGDSHSEAYSSEVYDGLKAYHDPHYGSFSRLIRGTFDQALDQFADGSIDLLHIDGLHTYEAVSHDFHTWRPKLSDRAVVLFHDTTERHRDFGVWKFWAEIESQFPSFEFQHSHGLGVLGVGKFLPQPMADFLADARAHAEEMRRLFSMLGGFHKIICLAKSLHDVESEVNRWKRQTGKPIHFQTEDFAAAQADPLTFAQWTAEDVKDLVEEILGAHAKRAAS